MALQERYYRARSESTASRTNNHVKIDACVLVNASGNFAIFGLFWQMGLGSIKEYIASPLLLALCIFNSFFLFSQQEISQADGSSLETSSISSPQPEAASHLHRTSCVNFQWVFHWLRTQVFSRWRREHPSQAPVSWHQKAVRKIHSLRGNRIQPQE